LKLRASMGVRCVRPWLPSYIILQIPFEKLFY